MASCITLTSVKALRITVGHLWTRRRHASSIAAADDGAREDAAPTLKQKIRAKARRLRKQLRGVFTAAFVVTSIFFLRTMVGGLDCSTVGYGEDAKLFMDREPATECNIDDPRIDQWSTMSPNFPNALASILRQITS